MRSILNIEKQLNTIGPNEQFFEGVKYAENIERAYKKHIADYKRIKAMDEGYDKYNAIVSLHREIMLTHNPNEFSDWIKHIADIMTSDDFIENMKEIHTSQNNIFNAKILVLFNEITWYKNQYASILSPSEILDNIHYYQRAEIQVKKPQDNDYSKRFKYLEDKTNTLEERIVTLEQNTHEHNLFVHAIKTAVTKTDSSTQKIHEKDNVKILLENEEFMYIMRKAVEQGFCTESGWQFIWKVKTEAAFFAAQASEKFNLSNRKDQEGDNAISWKPFEVLFNLEGLRLTYNDIVQCKTKVKRKKEILNLFK